jgi:hypothetical protein
MTDGLWVRVSGPAGHTYEQACAWFSALDGAVDFWPRLYVGAGRWLCWMTEAEFAALRLAGVAVELAGELGGPAYQ